jgi:predicted ATP-grasp superfamily ATP-dependent carboligase
MRRSGCDILVTYSWNRVGYNILRSLSSHGLNVWVADTSKNNICSRSRFCVGSFSYPDPFTKEREFIKVLKAKIAELHPRILLPTHDESLVIMRNRDSFPADMIIPYMDSDTLCSLSDKVWATDKAAECGIPVPRVYKSIEEVDSFPCVFKTAIGNSAKTVFFPENKQDLRSLSEKYFNTKVLIEEKIEGTDYSVDCVRWDGFFMASTYRALVTKTNGGGTSTQREIVDVPILEQFAKRFLDYVGFKGVCGLDFRYDPETGGVAFIEVNARFTGGLATPIAAGFDIPWVLYSLATTGVCDAPINIKDGTRTKWILGDIITLVGRLLSFSFDRAEWRQALSFNGFDAFDDYRSDDKRAFFGELSYYFGKLLRNRKLNP